MDKETKRRRAELLRLQTEIQENHCSACTRPPSSCSGCQFGQELRTIGFGLDQALSPRRVRKNGYIIPAITDEAKAIAKSNGIPITALRTRVQQLMWPLERAITEPIDENKRHKGDKKCTRKKI